MVKVVVVVEVVVSPLTQCFLIPLQNVVSLAKLFFSTANQHVAAALSVSNKRKDDAITTLDGKRHGQPKTLPKEIERITLKLGLNVV